MLNMKIVIAAGVTALLACTSLSAAAPTTHPIDNPGDEGGRGSRGGTGGPGGDNVLPELLRKPEAPMCKIVDGGLQIANTTGKTIKKGTILHITLQPSGRTIDWVVTKDIPPGMGGVIKNIVSPRDKATSCTFEIERPHGRTTEGGNSSSSSEEPQPPSSSSEEPRPEVVATASCQVWGNSYTPDGMIKIINSGNITFPDGTIVRLVMPDGTVVEHPMGEYVPGGDFYWFDLFPDGIPDGWVCDPQIILP